MNNALEMYLNLINPALEKQFLNELSAPQEALTKSMRYSLLAGGKRIRPVLTLMFCKASGGKIEDALPAACAVEMLHTYSLIHDDLPCMDNDDLRRGKPTNHKIFGECTATLAGDALQAEAFGTILRSNMPDKVRADCAMVLAEAAGIRGICGGQQLDMESDSRALNVEELEFVHYAKTASLIIAACKMGVIAAGGSENQLKAAELYGYSVGKAFQIRDDMLDVLSSESEMGKTVGTDIREGKTTSMTLYGEDGCLKRIEKLTADAKSAAEEFFADSGELLQMADMLCSRNN